MVEYNSEIKRKRIIDTSTMDDSRMPYVNQKNTDIILHTVSFQLYHILGEKPHKTIGMGHISVAYRSWQLNSD